jgi:hypothetical protein
MVSRTAGDASDILDYFPGEFQARQNIITGALISREPAASGISVTERESVHRVIASLVTLVCPSSGCRRI